MIWSGMRVRTTISLGNIVVSLVILSTVLRAQSSPPTNTTATISQLENDIPALIKKHNVPGVAIAVIHGGKTMWVHGFGVRNAKSGEPVTAGNVFEAASLSKTVFTYGVLKLVDQGRLGLDVPLTTYLPKPYTDDPRLEKITARIVLSHRTGFPNWRGAEGSLPIYFAPGERFSYSGEGYVVFAVM
jgi:CubicO group peptidase (beta-lactamase class C family)